MMNVACCLVTGGAAISSDSEESMDTARSKSSERSSSSLSSSSSSTTGSKKSDTTGGGGEEMDKNSSTNDEDYKEDDEDEDKEMTEKLLKQYEDYELAWLKVVSDENYSTEKDDDDAKFIARQMLELKSFLEEHRAVLGIDMMPVSLWFTLLSSTNSQELLFDSVLPMLKSKAVRDESSIEQVYLALTAFVQEAVVSTGRDVEDLLLDICVQELDKHNEWVSERQQQKQKQHQTNKSNIGKQLKSTTESIRAANFKSINLAEAKESRSEKAAMKSIEKRQVKLQQARAKASGWKAAVPADDGAAEANEEEDEEDEEQEEWY